MRCREEEMWKEDMEEEEMNGKGWNTYFSRKRLRQ